MLGAYLLPVILLFQVSSAQDRQFGLPHVACPNVFRYVYDPYARIYYGQLVAVPYGRPTIFELELNMTVQAAVPNNANIKVSVFSNQNEILSGGPIRYGIQFPLPWPVPKLILAKFNGVAICADRQDPLRPGVPQTGMWAKTTLRIGSASPQPPVQPVTEWPEWPWNYPTESPTPYPGWPWNYPTESPPPPPDPVWPWGQSRPPPYLFVPGSGVGAIHQNSHNEHDTNERPDPPGTSYNNPSESNGNNNASPPQTQ